MDKKEFGIIIKQIREDVFNLTQKEFADELGILQVTVSRIESGNGLTIDIYFKFIELLKKKNYNPAAIFYEPFDISLIAHPYSTHIDQIVYIAQEMKEKTIKEVDKIILLLNSI